MDKDNIIRINSIFESIKETSGKNDKIAILEKHTEDDLLISCLDLLYNDYVRTGLALSKINKKVAEQPTEVFGSIEAVINYLKENNTGSNVVIANVQNYINQFDEDIQVFLKTLFTKTLKCGITNSSVNKAFKKTLIPDFGCMLAHPYEKHQHKIKEDFFITQKFDGHRTLIFVDQDGVMTARTRKGHVIDGLVEIQEAVNKLLKTKSKQLGGLLHTGFVIDGEMILSDESIPLEDIFQETSKVLKKDGDKSGLQLNVFDLIPLDEFMNGESMMNYASRREIMDSIFGKNDIELLCLAEVLYHGSDKEEIIKWSNIATDRGWEGVMVNDSTAVYKTKRSPGLLKVKKFFSSDVEVIDVYEGGKGTRLEGELGGVVVKFKDFTVNVGSGFNDDERHDYIRHPELIVGKVIEIQYFEETENKKEGKSLRFPTFKRIREDKTLEDISYES